MDRAERGKKEGWDPLEVIPIALVSLPMPGVLAPSPAPATPSTPAPQLMLALQPVLVLPGALASLTAPLAVLASLPVPAFPLVSPSMGSATAPMASLVKTAPAPTMVWFPPDDLNFVWRFQPGC